jgi:hypothetical protein
MTPASSGLCSETWAWVEGNFVCHLFSSSVLKNLARFKNNAENWNKIKHMGSAFVFTYNPPISVIPSRIFQKTWYSWKKLWPDFVHSLWSICFQKNTVVIVGKRPSTRIQTQKNMVPSANRFQHHFKLIKIHLQTPLCFFLRSWHSLKWMFITIRKIFLQESASSHWKLCKIFRKR